MFESFIKVFCYKQGLYTPDVLVEKTSLGFHYFVVISAGRRDVPDNENGLLEDIKCCIDELKSVEIGVGEKLREELNFVSMGNWSYQPDSMGIVVRLGLPWGTDPLLALKIYIWYSTG